MKLKNFALLLPFIFICLGFLSIVIGAFLFNLILGFVVLGIMLVLVAIILGYDSPQQKQGEWLSVFTTPLECLKNVLNF